MKGQSIIVGVYIVFKPMDMSSEQLAELTGVLGWSFPVDIQKFLCLIVSWGRKDNGKENIVLQCW